MSKSSKAVVFIFLLVSVLSISSNVFCQVTSGEKDSARLIPENAEIAISKYKLQRVKRSGISQNALRPAPPSAQTLGVTPNQDEKGASEITIPPIVPPSPNSAVLANLISENVDLYTGKTSVNLPLYTLTCNSISLPISLQASANSHKVNDYGTWVGMGWNLNAGGVISRVMKSLPDEYTGAISSTFNIQGYGFTKMKSLQSVNLANFESAVLDTKKDIIYKGNWNQKNNLPPLGLDLQPDEFFFNFGSYSGKFVFDQDGNIHLIPQANFKVTPVYQLVGGINKISGFTILTDDGYTYDFGDFSLNAVEETKLTTESKSILYSYRTLTNPRDPINYLYGINGYIFYERTPYVLGNNITFVGPGAPTSILNFDEPLLTESAVYPQYPSSWYLTKITAPAGEWISFTYNSNGTISYLSDRAFSASIPDLADLNNPYGNDPNLYTRASYALPNLRPDLGIAVYPTNGTFTVTNSTIELVAKKLVTITTSQGNTVSFTANTNRNDFPSGKMLDQISITNNQATVIKRFNLLYEEKYNTDLTEKFKFSYNRTNNIFTPGATATYDYTSSVFTQETREWPVPEYCRYRTFLTSVQESGSTGISIPAYQFVYDHTNSLPYRTSTEQDKFGFANFNPSRFPFSSSNYSYNYPFYSAATYVAPNGTYGFPAPSLYFQTINAGDNLSQPPINFAGNKNYSVDRLKAGVLKKIIYPTGGFKEFFYELNGNAAAWNGLRVSEIWENDNLSATPVKKIYSYSPFIQNDDGIDKYVIPESVAPILPATNPLYYSTKKIFFSSGRVNPENSTKGGTGGYSWVEVSQTNNGKYRAEFSTATDYPSTVNSVKLASSCLTPNINDLGYTYPFPPADNPDWKRGLLKGEYFYKKDASMTTPLLIKSNLYTYDVATTAFGENNIIGMNSSVYRLTIYDVVLAPPCNGYNWNWLLYSKNLFTSKWYTLSSKTERNYAPDGVTYIESKDDYSYNKYTVNSKDYVYQGLTVNNSNSKNEQTVTKVKQLAAYTLPATYTGSDLFMLGLMRIKNKNILNAKIEEYSYRQDQLGANKKYLGGTLNRYGSPVSITDIYKLKINNANTFTESNVSGSTFTFDPNYNIEANFARINTGLVDGLISSQNKVNDIKEYYKWDYKRMYPVAKIITPVGTDADISYTSFETTDLPDEGTYSFNTPGTKIADAGATGDKVYQFTPATSITRNVNTSIVYVLSLWVKNGSVTVNGATALKTGRIVNGYQYQEWQVSGASLITIASNSAMIDELRLYPKGGLMTTYTYRPLTGMTAECGPSNNIIHYEYDALQRLITIYDQDYNIVKKFDYQYKTPATPFLNDFPQSKSVAKNDCPYSQFGTTQTLTVATGTFSSHISVADANQQALNYLNNNAQAYANQTGTCVQGVRILFTNNSGFTNSNISVLIDGVNYTFPPNGVSASFATYVMPGIHTFQFNCGAVNSYSIAPSTLFNCANTPVSWNVTGDVTLLAGSIAITGGITCNLSSSIQAPVNMCGYGGNFTSTVFTVGNAAIAPGVTLYYDAAFTQPVIGRRWVRSYATNTNTVYEIDPLTGTVKPLSFALTCPISQSVSANFSTTSSYVKSSMCGNGTIYTSSFYITATEIGPGVTLYTNSTLTQTAPAGYVRAYTGSNINTIYTVSAAGVVGSVHSTCP